MAMSYVEGLVWLHFSVKNPPIVCSNETDLDQSVAPEPCRP